MARIHGKNGKVEMDADGASPYSYVEIADLNNWTLDMSTERVIATAFSDTNIVRVAGLPDFSGDLGGLWNHLTTPTLFDAVLAGTPVQLKLTPDRNNATYHFLGLANVDGGIEVPVSGVVAVSGKWDAAGNWSMLP